MVNKKNSRDSVASSNELFKLLQIIIIVCLILVIFYFITVFVNDKKKNNSSKNGEYVSIIQYDKILVGEILNRNDNNYYVLVEKEDDVYNDLYKSYLDIYMNKGSSLPVYKVDLDDVFNRKYIGDKNSINSDLNNVTFSNTVLIKIQDKKIAGIYDNNETIVNHFEEIVK